LTRFCGRCPSGKSSPIMNARNAHFPHSLHDLRHGTPLARMAALCYR
jgi:hypothetical protein